MKRLQLALFSLACAAVGVALLLALLALLAQARFGDAARLLLPFAGGVYGTANLLFARHRLTAHRVQRRRSLYAAERALQAFLLLSIGTALLFACHVVLEAQQLALSYSFWLLAICALPMLLIVRAGVVYFFALRAVAARYLVISRLRTFARPLR